MRDTFEMYQHVSGNSDNRNQLPMWKLAHKNNQKDKVVTVTKPKVAPKPMLVNV